jgi:multiple sugar transport system ATP-binding protein
MAKVELRSINRRFGDVVALNSVSLTAEDGEFFVLLGASGAGKSTTINIVSGLENPDSGSVFLNDMDVTREFPQDRDVATAFEAYALYPHFTVNQNLLFPLEARRRRSEFTKDQRQERATAIAEMLGIDELLDRFPRELSGGQRQRVALGRTLVRSPQVYLLDEPIAHLDAKLRHRMRAELKKIQRNLGITTIYATPDQLEALSMGDKIAVLNEGVLEQVGPPEELYSRPANLYVARFVGEPPMNILEAGIEGSSAKIHGGTVRSTSIPQSVLALLDGGGGRDQVLIGIRPSDIQLCEPGDPESHIAGEVTLRDTLGQISIITVVSGGITIKAKINTDDLPELNSHIGLRFLEDRFHHFDVASHQRVG